MTNHESNRFGGYTLSGHNEVALILAIFVVEDENHAPGTKLRNDLLDVRNSGHGGATVGWSGRERVDFRHKILPELLDAHI